MDLLDKFAHAVIIILGSFARVMLSVLDFIEDGMRTLMNGAGLRSEMQTVVLIFVITMFLVGVLRLLKGRIRTSVSLILVLVLAHTLERIAHGPLG
jgi:hypothetical protein